MSNVAVNVLTTQQVYSKPGISLPGGWKVGSSHTGDTFTSATAFTISLVYGITFASYAKKLTFNLGYTTPVNSAAIVSGQSFRYGIGTSSSAPSSYNVFTWDTSSKRSGTLTIYGSFAANTTYYLWLFYAYAGQNNCYVDGVSMLSIEGDTTGEIPPAATVTVSAAKGYISGSNNWDAAYSSGGTNVYSVSDSIGSNRLIGVKFTVDKPLTALGLSITFAAVTGTVKYRVNQDTSPYTTPFLVEDTELTLTGATAAGEIAYAFQPDTEYWLWIYSSGTGRTPTFTFAPEVESYSVNLPFGTGYIVQAASGSTSPVLAGGSYSFSVTLESGYIKGASFAVKANGTELAESDGLYTISNITTEQTITVTGVELGGIVWISDGTSFEAYQAYIYTENGWELHIPYVYDGANWGVY